MQINDDTIRDAFAWPVRWDGKERTIIDGENKCVCIPASYWDRKGHDCALAINAYLGETIAAMLNERYAPKGGSDADKE